MQLIVISHTECFQGEGELLNSLFGEGMMRCHLRKPLATARAMSELLDAIAPAYYDRIALHQHHELSSTYGIKRLHFTEHHRLLMDLDQLERLKADGYALSTSVHNLQTAKKLPAVFSYAFFGPVFNSISKEDYHAIVGEDFYWPAEEKVVPMIALGGIDASNIGRVAAMNFDGAAVLGALWKEKGKAGSIFKRLNIPRPKGRGNKKQNAGKSSICFIHCRFRSICRRRCAGRLQDI
jgi:thiamine-phosphate pyrophosphorylase